MQNVRGFVLKNQGGFVCDGRIFYIDNDGNEQLTDDYGREAIGHKETMDAAAKQVPEDTVMRLYITIVAGDDRTGAPYFLCDYSSPNYAHYTVSGTTLNSHVKLDGVYPL